MLTSEAKVMGKKREGKTSREVVEDRKGRKWVYKSGESGISSSSSWFPSLVRLL